MIRAVLFVLALWLFFSTFPAYADQVVPSDRVETRLRVRDNPNTTATVVGFIHPGESAQLSRSVPYWYEITLDNGTRGFVSKGWSRVIPDAATASTVLRLGAWNIKKLGHGTLKDLVAVAQIIEVNYDIIAVVEVMQKAGGHPGYDDLITQLGSGWQGMVTTEPRPNTTSGSAEFYAIIYRPTMIRPCIGWTGLVYHQDNDGSGSDTGTDVFSRESAFSCFQTVNGGNPTGFDFVLAGYHARWADGDIDDISDEVEHLNDVFASMASAQPSEADLIVAGDFNLVPLDLQDAIDREIPTLGTGSTLNGQGERTENLYDHIVLFDSDATTEIIGTAEVLDVRDVARDNRTFFRTVSDHLPIVARFRTEGPDDD